MTKRKIEIGSNVYEQVLEDAELQALKKIKDAQDVTLLIQDLGDLSDVKIDEYSDDVFVFKKGGKKLGYIQGKDGLKNLIEQIEEEKNVKIQTQLSLQAVETEVRTGAGIDFGDLTQYKLGLLITMYQNAREGGSSTVGKLQEAILQKLKNVSQQEKIDCLDSIDDNNLYNKVIFEILKSITNSDDADAIFDKVGKERLQEVLKRSVLINDSFAESFTYYFNAPDDVRGFSVSCGEGYKDEESCESFTAYIFAMTKQYNFQNASVIANLVSKTFEGDLTQFKKDIASSIQDYKEIKGHLPDVAQKVLKEKGLIGLMNYTLDKTNMSPEQKQFWSEVGVPVIAVGVAIYMLFKFIKANGWKGLLGLLIGEIGLEATTGETSFSAFSKLLYGGADFLGSSSETGAKQAAEKTKFAGKLGFPMFVLFMVGEYKLSDLNLKFENGKPKFDVQNFIDSLPEDDERKVFLAQLVEKKGKDEVNKMFNSGLLQMGVTDRNYDKIKGKKINELFKNLLARLEKQEQQQAQQEVPSQALQPANPSNRSSIPPQPVVGTGSAGTSPAVGGEASQLPENEESVETADGEGVVVYRERGENAHLPIHTEMQEARSYSFRNLEELEQRVKEELKARLGEELYNKFNEKLKLLGNIETFMNYMKIYASINNDEDLGTFSYGSNFYDEMPIFINGAGFPSYKNLFENLLTLATKGDKNRLEFLLNKLDDKGILSTLENINGQMIKNYNFYFFKHKEDTPLDTQNERQKVLDMLKNGNKFEIEKFFLYKMKTPDFLQSDIMSNTRITGINVNTLIDGSLQEATNNVYNNMNNFYIYGKKINLNVDKDTIKDILEDLRKDTANMSKKQRVNYVYSMLVGKLLNDNEDAVLNSLSGDIKEKLKVYYDTVGPWDSVKQRWQSNLMKGLPILGAIIVSDGFVSAILPEGGAILGTARFAARVAMMHNVGGNMSLLLNDQWSVDKAIEMGSRKNRKEYMHTAAYMAVFEMFALASKTIGQAETFQRIGGTLEKVGLRNIKVGNKEIKSGVINLKNASIYGLNVGGILVVDTVVFDGEFTAEELTNALIFGALAFRGGNFKISKSSDGKVKIEEVKQIKERGEEVKDRLKTKKEALEQDRDVIEQDIDTINQSKQQKQQELQDLRNDLSLKESGLVAKKTELDLKEKELQDLHKQKDLFFDKITRLKDVFKKLVRDPQTSLNDFFRDPSQNLKDFWDNKIVVKQLLNDIENGHYNRIILDPNVPREIKTAVREYNDVLSDISRIEGEKSGIETDIQAKESEINTIDVQISLRNSEISRLNREIQRKETSIGRVDKRTQRELENYLFENVYKGQFRKNFVDTIKQKVKAKETFEQDLGNGIKIETTGDGEVIITENGNARTVKFKEFKREFNEDLINKADKTEILKDVNKEIEQRFNDVLGKVEYTKDIGSSYKIDSKRKPFKVDGKEYVVAKKGDDFYLVEKKSDGSYELREAKEIDKFIEEHPEYVEEVYQKSTKGIEGILKKTGLWNKKVSTLPSMQQNIVAKIIGKPLGVIKDWTVGNLRTGVKDMYVNAIKEGLLNKNKTFYQRGFDVLYSPIKWIVTGKANINNGGWTELGDITGGAIKMFLFSTLILGIDNAVGAVEDGKGFKETMLALLSNGYLETLNIPIKAGQGDFGPLIEYLAATRATLLYLGYAVYKDDGNISNIIPSGRETSPDNVIIR